MSDDESDEEMVHVERDKQNLVYEVMYLCLKRGNLSRIKELFAGYSIENGQNFGMDTQCKSCDELSI